MVLVTCHACTLLEGRFLPRLLNRLSSYLEAEASAPEYICSHAQSIKQNAERRMARSCV
jgi:hypothetical protein